MRAEHQEEKKDDTATMEDVSLLVEVEVGWNAEKDGVSRRKTKQVVQTDPEESNAMDAPLLQKKLQHQSGSSSPPQRWSSLDVVRGIAIFVMLVVHIFMDVLDYEMYISTITARPLINVAGLVVFSVFGGSAGIFLLCSSIGNMLSIQKSLERNSAFTVAKKHVVGGFMLLSVAMVAEAFIGNHGVIGELVRNLHQISKAPLDKWKYQAYHIEAIHAVAWCNILNGATHYLISKIYDLKTQTNKVCRAYGILACAVLFLTPIIWSLASAAIPGYPFAINSTTGQQQYLPTLGVSPWQDFVVYFFLNPLAAPFEPVFPYLATSYIGSIIGLRMAQAAAAGPDYDRRFLRRFYLIGLVMFISGGVGLACLLISTGKFCYALWDHRYWTSENGLPGGWFWQYLLTNGVGLTLTTYFMRMMEFRGESGVQQSIGATVFLRRIGNQTLTVYMLQWFYFVMFLLAQVLLGLEPYKKTGWGVGWLTVILTCAFYNYLLVLWGKIGFIGSLEWLLGTIKGLLVPRKEDVNKKWWELGRIEVEGTLLNISPVSFKSTEEDDKRLLLQEAIAFWFHPFMGFIATPRHIQHFQKLYPDADLRKYWKLYTANVIFWIILFGVMFTISIDDVAGWVKGTA